MKRAISESYRQTFPGDWLGYIKQVLELNSSYINNELVLRRVRQEVKGRLEAEMYKLTSTSGIAPNEMVNIKRISDIYDYVYERRIWPVRGLGSGHCVSGIDPISPFPDPGLISGLAAAAAEHEVIRGELHAVGRRITTDTREFIYTGTWRSISLWESSQRTELPARQLFRQTMEILLSIPLFERLYSLSEIKGGFRGFTVRFSMLRPGTHILPHYGLTNTRLRIQVPIEVPTGDLFIYSHNQVRSWSLGTPLVLNDAYIHGVQNNGDADRIVLLVDIPHPDALEDDYRSY